MTNKSTFIVFIGMLFRRNIPFYKPRILTIRVLYNGFFIVLRAFLLIFVIVEILPDYIEGLCVSVTLLHDNWWHSKEEGFITNCSYINAGICWIMWVGIFSQVVNFTVWVILYIFLAPITMVRLGILPFIKI
jgi:hypothetical protein